MYSPREAVSLAVEAIGRGERVGLLFGSEKNGLSNDELTYVSEHRTHMHTRAERACVRACVRVWASR